MLAKTSMPSFWELMSVLERRLVGMGAHEFAAEGGDNLGELLLHRLLGGPAQLVGGLAQVSVADEQTVLDFFMERRGLHGSSRILARCMHLEWKARLPPSCIHNDGRGLAEPRPPGHGQELMTLPMERIRRLDKIGEKQEGHK